MSNKSDIDLYDTEDNLSISDMSDWNADIQEDINPRYEKTLQLSPRDWTVATIVDQIELKNIDLNPKFQRRNAWDDKRRSRLIESLMLGVPVPQITLAEVPGKRGSFIIIDGKQRLLTIAGFLNPLVNPFWDTAQIKGLEVLTDLNGMTFEEIKLNLDYERELTNATIRCSVISNYRNDDILYDIFYRLNTGSVPLSTQELRQVLNPGIFADYLIERTNNPGQPIHSVLGLRKPDKRLRDVELILRFISLLIFGNEYKSNLKRFLDTSMARITNQWEIYGQIVNQLYDDLNKSLKLLIDVFEDDRRVGRKITSGKWETRFNKVLLEVQAYYFLDLINIEVTSQERRQFLDAFKELCKDPEFRSSIESSTKNNNEYVRRFTLFRNMMQTVFNIEFRPIPVKETGKE